MVWVFMGLLRRNMIRMINDAAAVLVRPGWTHVCDLWCAGLARLGPLRLTELMAPSPRGSFLRALLFIPWAAGRIHTCALPLPFTPNRDIAPSPVWLPLMIGRHQRRRLTGFLNQQAPPPETTWDPLLPWRNRPWVRLRRRHPHLREVGRQRWCGQPLRGIRIGEAQNPGPPMPGTPLGGDRPPERGRPKLPARDVCFALCQFVPAPTLIGRGAGPAGQL